MPNVLRVLIMAPREVRVREVMAREHLATEEAKREVDRVDRNRREFVEQVFGVSWSDPTHYDCMLNTGKYSKEFAAWLISNMAWEQESRSQATRAA